MKKSIKYISIMLALSLFISSCSNKENKEDKNSKAEITENTNQVSKDEKNKEDQESKEEIDKKEEKIEAPKDEDLENKKEQEESPSEDKKIQEDSPSENRNFLANGQYLTILASESGGKAQGTIGYCQEAFADASTSTFTIKGSLSYSEEVGAFDSYEIVANSTYDFSFDENTTFQATSGMAEPHIMTVDEFNSYLEECKDTGLGLVLVIENGLVKSASISS
ncbi:hypothetical protein [Anaerococcus sp.]|uniref:hypothetical protein n=1 Tax=Anaerococcus sp. TaxID=1872515 RepID=UPI002A750661|nr:hypothetical protein [Anaerococcus sp.]MDY2927746.1 hypothetical protein [Anaerococcus sp.]